MEENMIIEVEQNEEVVETKSETGALTKVVLGLAVVGVASIGRLAYKKAVKPLINKVKAKKEEANANNDSTNNNSDEE